MKSVKFLEKLQKAENLNDSEVAKLLQISKSAISQYKSGSRVMDDETCLAIAQALDINPMEVIGAACIDRAEKTGQKSLWENFLMRATHSVSAALFLAVFVNLFLTPLPADAATMRVSTDQSEHTINYAK